MLGFVSDTQTSLLIFRSSNIRSTCKQSSLETLNRIPDLTLPYDLSDSSDFKASKFHSLAIMPELQACYAAFGKPTDKWHEQSFLIKFGQPD